MNTHRGEILFREQSATKKATKAKTTEHIMHNLYFLMQEGKLNRKVAHLNELVALKGSEENEYFQPSSQ